MLRVVFLKLPAKITVQRSLLQFLCYPNKHKHGEFEMPLSNADFVTSNIFVLLDEGFIFACLRGIEYSITQEILKRRIIKVWSGLARTKMQELRRHRVLKK